MPRKRQPEPTAMDQLDPAPPPARRPRRRKGAHETAVLHDLASLPESMRKGGIAVVALQLAIELDSNVAMTPRDRTAMAAQVRMSLVTLAEMAPGEARGDATDEVRAKRERRLGAQAG